MTFFMGAEKDKMTKEKTLSEKIHGFGIERRKVKKGFFWEKDVKKSIKKILEELEEKWKEAIKKSWNFNYHNLEEIKKIIKEEVGNLE